MAICILIQINFAYAEVIRLEPTEKNQLKLEHNNIVKDKNLVIQDKSVVEDLIQNQKEDEIKDIELLWRATIENNTLIKFTMNKLNTPESQRRLHSSIMAKSLSSLIYGASFIPMFTGSNAMLQSASFSAGRLANNFLNKESKDIKYENITEVAMFQNIWARLLKVGNIHIKTNVEYNVGLYMPFVAKPKQTVEQIRKIISEGNNEEINK